MTDETKKPAPAATKAKRQSDQAERQFSRKELKAMGLDPAPYGYTADAE